MNFKLYAKLEDGESIELKKKSNEQYSENGIEVIFKQKKRGPITACYVSAKSDKAFDPDCAVSILIEEIEGLQSYVSGSSTYTDYNCWYAPVFGRDLKNVPPITQSFMWNGDTQFGAILCACDDYFKSEMMGTKKGLEIRIFDGDKGETEIPESLVFLIAEGENPFELNDGCVAFAKELSGRECFTREDRKYPEIFEYLGWCSWDAFQIRVSEENLLQKCEEFKSKNIPVKWAILDDMWADCTDLDTARYDDFQSMMKIMKASKLNSFEASPKRFPDGLRHAIEEIKKYGLKVGIWHPTTGYWKGINPESELFDEYYQSLVENIDGWYQPSFDENNRFYDGFHKFLKECGAEFLKVDNQSSFHFNKGMMPIGQMAKGLHKQIEASAKKYFDNAMINCMGLAVENMWARPESAVTRCSDDFQPENKEWFKKHILRCTVNSLFIGAIMWCDYDMWWTDDAQAGKNSLLRAVSGGPVYVSDTLGRSKKEVLEPLCLSDGRILRCDRPAVPTKDCLFDNPIKGHKIFKVQNTADDCGIIAVYNLHDSEKASGIISPMDVEGLKGDNFVVYEYYSKAYFKLKHDEKANVELENDNDYRLYIIIPVTDDIAFLGLSDKYISPKTYEKCSNKFMLKETGKTAFVTDKEVKAVKVNGNAAEFKMENNLYTFEAGGTGIEILLNK